MDVSILYPPNNHKLSSNVIFDVKQRARTSRSCVGAHVGVNAQDNSNAIGQIQFHTADRKQPTHTRQQCDVSGARAALQTIESPQRNMTVAELLRLGEKLHRERRRNNQRRYRKKQDDYMASLEKDTWKLRKEIEKLKCRHHNGPSNDLVKIAMKYFNLVTQDDRFSKTATPDFVKATMVPDVLCHSGCGPDAVVKGMRVLQWFNNVDIKLESLQLSTNDLVVAQTTTLLTITERTLHYLFPHLFRSSDENLQLLTKLLGQRIVVRGSTCFGWDGIAGRVTSVSTQSDLLTPMLHILGNLEDVSRVFEKAFITLDLKWSGTTL